MADEIEQDIQKNTILEPQYEYSRHDQYDELVILNLQENVLSKGVISLESLFNKDH